MMRHFSLCDSKPCEYDNCISLGLAHRRVYLWRQGVNCVRTDGTSARRVLSSSIRRCGLMALVLGLGAAHASAQLLQSQKLSASDATAGKAFGTSVSVSGDRTVVGAYGDFCRDGANCGSAYVYRFDGATWVEEQKLAASDAEADDFFGYTVSASGDVILIGAPYADCPGEPRCGVAYVFRFDGVSWVEEQKLTASDADDHDMFGWSVSVSGERAVVGAPDDGCALGFVCGTAYVFRFNGSSWVEEQKLTASDEVQVGHIVAKFGVSVSVSGEAAIVGAHGIEVATGAAYVYRFDGGSWLKEQKLTASDASSYDFFGFRVSLSGSTVAVGAPGYDCSEGRDCGAAYIFRFDGSSWVEEQKLTASDAKAEDVFGFPVSVSGSTVIVGAVGHDCTADINDDCGAAYVYAFKGTSWVEQQQLVASDAGTGDTFGNSISVSDGAVVIGAPNHDSVEGSDFGAAYVFRPQVIPAMSAWSLAILTILLAAAGTIVIRRTAS